MNFEERFFLGTTVEETVISTAQKLVFIFTDIFVILPACWFLLNSFSILLFLSGKRSGQSFVFYDIQGTQTWLKVSLEDEKIFNSRVFSSA